MGASPRAPPPSIVPVWRSPLRGVTLGGATPTSASAVSRDDTRLSWDVTADGLWARLPAVNGLRLGAPSPGEDVRPRSSPRPLPADVPTPRRFMATPTCLISRPPSQASECHWHRSYHRDSSLTQAMALPSVPISEPTWLPNNIVLTVLRSELWTSVHGQGEQG